MATDLKAGAVPGKKTKLYYNSDTHASPVWVEIPRARNVQNNRGPGFSDVQYHGTGKTKGVHDYAAFAGSFEYVRKKGADTVFDALDAARINETILDLAFLDGPENSAESKGWRAPVILGEFAEVANGGDPLVVTIPFQLADAYDATETEIVDVPFTGTDPGP